MVQQAGGFAALVPRGEEPGFGVWNTDTGELLFWTEEWTHTEFTASGLVALAGDRLVLMAWPEMTEIGSLPVSDATSLAVSASQKVVVVGQSDELAGGGYFWVPEDEENDDWFGDVEIPSIGGRVRFGDLVIHDLADDTVTVRELLVDLPEGWRPAACDDPQWTRGASELRFESAERLRLRLPDGVWVDVTVQGPDSIVLPGLGRDIR